MKDIILVIVAYFIGAIPTGYLFGKVFFCIDITEHGSGNIGASNIARVLGKRWFVFIFLIDAFKAYAALQLNSSFGGATEVYVYAVSIGLLVGNAYSLFLRFKGGKGVATAVGIFAYLLPLEYSLAFVMVWSIILGITRKPFIASLVSIVTVSILYSLMTDGAHTPFLIFVCLWVGFRHMLNVKSWCKNRTMCKE